MDTLSPPMSVWDLRLKPQSAFPIKYFKRKYLFNEVPNLTQIITILCIFESNN